MNDPASHPVINDISARFKIAEIIIANRIGAILLDLGFVDEEQLKDALNAQSKQIPGSRKQKLGEILLELGLISPQHLEKALRLNQGIEILGIQ
jgi:hypothetical protein